MDNKKKLIQTSWGKVADWYDELLKNEDYLKRVRTEDLREEKWHRGVTWTE